MGLHIFTTALNMMLASSSPQNSPRQMTREWRRGQRRRRKRGQYPDPPSEAITGISRRTGRGDLGEDVRLAHGQSPLAAGGALIVAGGVPCMAFSNGSGRVSR